MLLGLYALCSGGLTALGRSNFPINHALASRYATFSLYIYLATLVQGVLLYKHYRKTANLVTPTALSFSAGLVLGLFLCLTGLFYIERLRELSANPRWGSDARRRGHAAVLFGDLIPDNPDLSILYPWPNELRVKHATLVELGVFPTPDVNTDAFREQLVATGIGDTRFGVFDSCKLAGEEGLKISGWAVCPESETSGDLVLLVATDATGVQKPFSVVPVSVARPDVVRHFKEPSFLRSGFQATVRTDNLPSGPIRISAWVVDQNARRPHQLRGTHQIALPFADYSVVPDR